MPKLNCTMLLTRRISLYSEIEYTNFIGVYRMVLIFLSIYEFQNKYP